MALEAFSELVHGEVSHLPHVHGNQCLYVLALHSCSRIALQSKLFLPLLALMFSCHSHLILELNSSMKSTKRRSFNEFPLVFISLTGEMQVPR